MRCYLILWSFLIIGMFAGCGDKIEPGSTPSEAAGPVTVQTDIVKPVVESRQHEAVGTVKPRLTSTLSSKVMGTVSKVNVEEGQQVKKGEPLVILTQKQIDADYERAQAALSEAQRGEATAKAGVTVAKANAELARATHERYQKLVAGESASPQEFDEIKAKHEAAKAAVIQAESMLAAAKKRVEGAEAMVTAAAATTRDMVVSAPYDGVITEKLVEPGDLASPGRPLLRLEGFEGYRVVFVLEEALIQAVRVGQRLDVALSSIMERRIQGEVESISPVADVATRSVEVKLSLPSIPGLRSGLFARVFIPAGTVTSIRMPESAIVKRGQLTGVYKVDEKGILRFRLVRTGRHDNGQVEILSGMKAEDRYVVTPGPETRNGQMAKEAS